MTNLKKYAIRLIAEDGNRWEYRRVFNEDKESSEIDKLMGLVDEIDEAADAERSSSRNVSTYYVFIHEYREKYELDRSIVARVDKDLVANGSSKVEDLFSKMTKIIKS